MPVTALKSETPPRNFRKALQPVYARVKNVSFPLCDPESRVRFEIDLERLREAWGELSASDRARLLRGPLPSLATRAEVVEALESIIDAYDNFQCLERSFGLDGIRKRF